jgi:hypothetical protein
MDAFREGVCIVDKKQRFLSIGRIISFSLVMMLLSGCSVIQGLTGGSSAPPGAEQTAIAEQVAALAATAAAQQPLQPAQPEQPTLAPQPTYTPFPTYTMLPTYTAVPTFTPLPTYTLLPTFSQPTFIPTAGQAAATPNPEQRGCCTLSLV